MNIKKIIAIASVFLFALFFCFYQIFSGHWILSQSFALGPVTIHYYGLVMALAVAAAFYLAIKRSGAFGIAEKTAEDLLFWLAIGGFLGARLYHVLTHFSYYWIHPFESLQVWHGGLSIYGAILGGLLTLVVAKNILHPCLAGRQAKSYILNFLDWLTPSLILGQIIGRFGNMFNYEAFGYPTSLPWKMFIPEQFRPVAYQNFNFFHPWFLYEAIGNTIILIFMIRYFRTVKAGLPSEAFLPNEALAKLGAKEGQLFFSYLLLYNVLRFALEFQRTDSSYIGIARLNAITALVLALIGICGIFYSNRKHAQQS